MSHIKRSTSLILVIIAVIVIIVIAQRDTQHPLATLEATSASPVTSVPDFTHYADVKEKKQAFFDFLHPIIIEQNQFIRAQRTEVKQLKTQFEAEGSLSQEHTQLLMAYAEAYHIEEQPVSDELFTLLLRRVDVIPPSLAMAQAAIESGWGTSRFAQQGNNLFGHWCFSKGCGFVPAARDGDKSHEVAKFDTVNEAVRKYMRNLNAYHPYVPMRDIRLNHRKTQAPITGTALAKGLIDYSELKEQYIFKVDRMIKQNKLTQYDKAAPANPSKS